jgi:hypothetical protein
VLTVSRPQRAKRPKRIFFIWQFFSILLQNYEKQLMKIKEYRTKSMIIILAAHLYYRLSLYLQNESFAFTLLPFYPFAFNHGRHPNGIGTGVPPPEASA